MNIPKEEQLSHSNHVSIRKYGRLILDLPKRSKVAAGFAAFIGFGVPITGAGYYLIEKAHQTTIDTAIQVKGILVSGADQVSNNFSKSQTGHSINSIGDLFQSHPTHDQCKTEIENGTKLLLNYDPNLVPDYLQKMGAYCTSVANSTHTNPNTNGANGSQQSASGSPVK